MAPKWEKEACAPRLSGKQEPPWFMEFDLDCPPITYFAMKFATFLATGREPTYGAWN